MKSSILPESVLRRMSPEDRRTIKQETATEAQQAQDDQSERFLQKLIHNDLLRLQSAGESIWFYHARMDRPTTCAKGVPDFLLILGGALNRRFIALECKVGKNDLSPDQALEGAKIRAAGGEFHVVRTFDEYRKAILP